MDNGELRWKVQSIGGSAVLITDCDIDNEPPCASPRFGESVYSSTMELSGSNYRLTLTIHSVVRLRDQTIWIWESRGVAIGQCDLDVYCEH